MANGLEVQTSRALVTLSNAAIYLSCSRRHVERLLARGELPRVRLGRAVRVSLMDLDRYIATVRSGGHDHTPH
jgi:excisionase family DNA binding protein